MQRSTGKNFVVTVGNTVLALLILLLTKQVAANVLPANICRDLSLRDLEIAFKRDPTIVTARDVHGSTLLHLAILGGDNPRTVACLVGWGADVNASNNQGQTPLLIAVGQTSNFDNGVVAFLLEHGANPNTPDSSGVSPLLAAVDNNLTVFLRNHGAEVNLRNRFGTPLEQAVEYHLVDKITTLISLGAEINTLEPHTSYSPLHRAALFGYDDVVTILVKAGADVNLRAADGSTPMDVAQAFRRTTTVALLTKLGAVSFKPTYHTFLDIQSVALLKVIIAVAQQLPGDGRKPPASLNRISIFGSESRAVPLYAHCFLDNQLPFGLLIHTIYWQSDTSVIARIFIARGNSYRAYAFELITNGEEWSVKQVDDLGAILVI